MDVREKSAGSLDSDQIIGSAGCDDDAYISLARTLADRIAKGDYEVGDLLLEASLTREFPVSVATVRRAIEHLKQQGAAKVQSQARPHRSLAGRSVAELTADELQVLAIEAFSAAARDAEAHSLSPPGYADGRITCGLEDDAYIDRLRKVALGGTTSAEPTANPKLKTD